MWWIVPAHPWRTCTRCAAIGRHVGDRRAPLVIAGRASSSGSSTNSMATLAMEASGSASGFRWGGSLSRWTRKVPPGRGVSGAGGTGRRGLGRAAISSGGGRGKLRVPRPRCLSSLAAAGEPSSFGFFLRAGTASGAGMLSSRISAANPVRHAVQRVARLCLAPQKPTCYSGVHPEPLARRSLS